MPLLVPPVVMIVTNTVPVPAGATAVICVPELTVKDAAGVPPNNTVMAPVRFVPVMVTVLPPASGPILGLTDAAAGAGM